MYAGKPIIGISGGIGSGKSFVAGLFGELGCLVLSADEHVRQAYLLPEVKQTLRDWWGDSVLNERGEVKRKRIGAIVFKLRDERKRLESLLHPIVDRIRWAAMEAAAHDPKVRAFVWDVPLLFEVGLAARCDALVFVEASAEDRLERVIRTRGWDFAEFDRREKLQLGLDNKRQMSKYSVQNTADVGFVRQQVEAVLKDVLANSAMGARRKQDSSSSSESVD